MRARAAIATFLGLAVLSIVVVSELVEGESRSSSVSAGLDDEQLGRQVTSALMLRSGPLAGEFPELGASSDATPPAVQQVLAHVNGSNPQFFTQLGAAVRSDNRGAISAQLREGTSLVEDAVEAQKGVRLSAGGPGSLRAWPFKVLAVVVAVAGAAAVALPVAVWKWTWFWSGGAAGTYDSDELVNAVAARI
jgi:SdpC family antimicrobial peptide